MYTLIIFSLIGVALSVSVVKREELIENKGWQTWKLVHHKQYTNIEEENIRFTIWEDNFRRITEFNQKGSDVFLAMNHFGDLTNTEYRQRMNTYSTGGVRRGSTFLTPSNVVLPDSVDWRTKGMVTPIKNQGQCGSCWAFSATGSLEGQHQKKTGNLVSLSEQNLVDCSGKFGNLGCNGGLMDSAFEYIKANGGIDTEASYPYVGVQLKCRFNNNTIGATVTGYKDIPSGDENALQSASASIGPISVAIDASHFSFQFYSTGVYNEARCSTTQLDHGVLAVGYGTAPSGKAYWLVKNSWGPGWGKHGYIWMSRNKNNQCGIATSASYPLV